MNLAIILLYLVALIFCGYMGKRRAKNAEDFRVAGRRLGPLLYTGTMSAVVLGGASTVGGVGLGYTYGLSGMWLVVAIATGVVLLSLIFAPIISKLKIYTVSQMLSLRYGVRATQVSSIVMLGYTLMITVTSTAVARVDVIPFLTGKPALEEEGGDSGATLATDRIYLLILGLVATVLAIFLTDTVTSLTIAYDILVGGLMVAILGGLLWRRGTGAGAAASMLVGSVVTLASMPIFGVLANEPIYYGLASSLVVYVAVSLLTKPTSSEVMNAWDTRLQQHHQRSVRPSQRALS